MTHILKHVGAFSLNLYYDVEKMDFICGHLIISEKCYEINDRTPFRDFEEDWGHKHTNAEHHVNIPILLISKVKSF